MKQPFTHLFVFVVTLILSTIDCIAQSDPYLSQPLTLKANAATTVYLAKTSNAPSVTFANLFLQYSTDGGETWTSFAASSSTTKLTINAGDSLMLRRNPDKGINTNGFGNNTSNAYDYRWYFVTTGDYALAGNIMSLVDGTNFATNTTIPATYCCFNSMFINNTALKNIDNLLLPATTLKNRCYRSLFEGCKGLTQISNFSLPEPTTAGAYSYLRMFYGCTGLTTLNGFRVPAKLGSNACENMFYGSTGLTNLEGLYLSADTLSSYCYRYMFNACTGLTSVVDTFRVSVIGANSCDQMFLGCNKLRQTPVIKVDSIGSAGCINMFKTCGTALTGTDSMTAGDIIVSKSIYNQGLQTMYAGSTRLRNAPAITASRVFGTSKDNGGCRYMFQDLTSITSAGEINIGQLDAYGCNYMFTGCTKLKRIPKMTIGKFNGTYNMQYMFNGCTGLTFNNDTLYNKQLSNYCYLYMFTGCTGITDVSKLHLAADTLAPYAYNYMFSGCTGITTMWDTLHISVIGDHSCQYMFNGCTKIKRTSALVVDSIGAAGCHVMFAGCGTATATADSMTAGDIIVRKAIYNNGCQQMYHGSTKLKKTPNVYAERVMGTATKTGGCYLMFNLPKVPRMGKLVIKQVDTYGCELLCSACTTLVALDTIQIDSLGTYGLNNAFSGCTKLTKIPKILVNKLVGHHNMNAMFNGCTSLTFNNDTLYNKQLSNYCYCSMFNNCTGLSNIEGLHIAADTLAPYACNLMFSNCSTMTAAVDTLRFKVIGEHSCDQMFSTCKKLDSSPVIYVDSIGVGGCYRMFVNCSTNATVGLSTAGSIVVNGKIASLGCNEMFSGCLRLAKAPSVFAEEVMSTNATATGGCYNMFLSLKVTEGDKIKIGKIDAFGCEMMYSKCTLMVAMDTIICTDSVGQQGCQKMFDGCTNANFTQAPKIIANKVGLLGLYQMYTGRTNFTSSDTLRINQIGERGCEQLFSGCTKLASLPYVYADTIGRRGCEKMFSGCTALKLGKDTLPTMALGPQAYSYLFNGCTAIDDLSQLTLPAMQLGDSCYMNMFQTCTGLTDISTFKLPAQHIAKYAYANMFNSCGNITTAWDTIKTSIIGEMGCYQQFNACKKLAVAPAIKVDSIGPKGCQQMFVNCSTSTTVGLSTAGDIVVNGKVASLGLNNIYSGCQNLITAPNVTIGYVESNGTSGTGGCYRMFNGLTGLTQAGYLRAGTIGQLGCQQMFQGCTKLTAMDSIIVDSIGTQGCQNMFINDALFASAPKITAGVIGEKGCYQFCNCTTAITSADTIRAQKVYKEGLREMFNACTKLERSPYIQIDSVGLNGCLNMFKGCYTSATVGLLTADSICIDKMGTRACESMFEGCTRLATIKGFKNTTIHDYACTNMFKTCTSLTDISAVILPAQVMGAYCYNNMYNACTGITTVWDTLRVSVIGEQSCAQMFNGCKKLAAAPAIVVDSIGPSGCWQMFLNCSTSTTVGLNTAGDIVVNGKVASLGLSDIYSGCQRLATAPNITIGRVESKGTVGTGGCYRMFNGLTGLTKAGYLRAGTIGQLGCQQMFQGCTKLTGMDSIMVDSIGTQGCLNMFINDALFASAPKITAGVIGEQGCYQMLNCTTAITTADTIRAQKVHKGGLQEMFKGCLKLAASPYMEFDTLGYRACYQMFAGCYTSTTVGLRLADSLVVYQAIGDHACEEMFSGCSRMDIARGIATPMVRKAGCKNMYKDCFKANTGTLPRYSEGFGDNTVLLADSACHQMFNTCTYLDSCADLHFSTIGAHGCDNMFYLSNNMDVSPAITAQKVKDYGCYQMFNYANTAATTAPVGFDHARDVNFGEVGNRGCYQMYFQCRKLSTAPNLTINKVGDHGCYQMFSNAYSFVSPTYYGIASIGTFSIQEIGAYGCAEMFSGCQRLTASPAIIPVSVGAHGCEKMFYNCYVNANVGLQTAGVISTNSVANYGFANMFEGCKRLTSVANNEVRADYVGDYGFAKMFNGCTALITTPAVQAGELGKYACQYMFNGCTALVNMPLLPTMKIDDYTYSHMLEGCTALENVSSLPATTLTEGSYEYMFNGCTKLTAAPEMTATTLTPNCYQFMYQGCTSLTQAPTLPATKLTTNCYSSMFRNCTSLQTAPTLPATELQTGCYTNMFNGCTALNYMKVNFTDWRYFGAATDPTYNWVSGVSGTGEFNCPEALEKTKDASHIPAKFTAQSLASYKLTFDANTGTWADGSSEQIIINQSDIDAIPHATKRGSMFVRWNTEPDGTGDDLNLGNLEDRDMTFYAQYQSIGAELQKWQSNALFLSITSLPETAVSATLKVVGGGSSKSCYLESSSADQGVYKLVFNKNDVQYHPGGVMDIILADENDVQLGVVSVQIPFLIKENTLSSSLANTENKDICVLGGTTLTLDENRTCRQLIVSAGAKVVVPAGKTLTTGELILRGGDLNNATYYYDYPQLVVNGRVVNTSNKVVYQYLTGLQQQYTLCLPADVKVSDVTYPDGTPATLGVYRYNGQKRAQGKSGWEEIWDPTVGGTAPTLKAGQGYTVYGVPSEMSDGKRPNYCYLNFPMTIDLSNGELPTADSMTVNVTHYGMTNGKLNDGVAANNAGWNLVGNPFLANFVGTNERGFENGVIGELQKVGDKYEWVGSARYVVLPANNGQSYQTEMISNVTLPAFKNFFIQIGKGDAIRFAKASRVQNAPNRYMQQSEETMLGIRLSGNETEDRVGVLIGEQFTDEYEINADLDKWTNQNLNLSIKLNQYNLAIAAINDERLLQPIPLTIKTSKAGTYIFSQATEWTANGQGVSHLYLFDSQKNSYTDLLEGSLTVDLNAQTYANRFSLVIEKKQITTEQCEIHEEDMTLTYGKGMLCVNGLMEETRIRVYSMVGTCVYSASISGSGSVSLPKGTYVVTAENANHTYVRKISM